MTDHDVIIVGAGPAGSTLARQLKRQGKNVLLLDKSEFPRNKVCAGWVTPEVLQSIAFDSAAYVASGRTLQPIHGFHVGLIGELGVAWQEAGKPVSFGIRRCEFDSWLLDQAEVNKQLGVKVKSIEREGAFWSINGAWRAPLLVGAGGHFCPVAARLGDGPGSHETVVAAKELELELDDAQAAACRVGEDQPQLWFCPDLKGYAWVFRKGRFINIGLGREDNHQLSDHLHDFVHWLEQQGMIPVLGDHYHGHAYLLYDHARRSLVDDGVMLVGDAAGLAYTQSGEGIRPAIESALLAAQTLAEVPDLSAASLALYEHKMAARFGARQRGKVVEGDWFGFKKAIARPLMRTRWFTREVVAKRWFLHQQVPALVP